MEYEDRVGAYAHEIFGGLASEGGLDHLAPTLDFALYLWSYPDWEGKPEKLADRHVPLWQLVYPRCTPHPTSARGYKLLPAK